MRSALPNRPHRHAHIARCAEVILCISRKAGKAILFTLKQIVAKGNRIAVEICRLHRCFDGVTVVTPCKVQQRLIAEASAVRYSGKNDSLKIVCGFHCALKRTFPEMAV